MTMYEKMCAVYEMLAFSANDDGVYTGSIVQAYNSTGMNGKFYSPVMSLLRETGSIDVVQRGNRVKDTIIRLNGMPTREQYDQAVASGLTAAYRDTRVGSVERRLRELEGRLPDVDLRSYIVSLESRLQALEERLTNAEIGANIGETTTNNEAS